MTCGIHSIKADIHKKINVANVYLIPWIKDFKEGMYMKGKLGSLTDIGFNFGSVIC